MEVSLCSLRAAMALAPEVASLEAREPGPVDKAGGAAHRPCLGLLCSSPGLPRFLGLK